jgi:DNA-binding transcriptional LysR family regulator
LKNSHFFGVDRNRRPVDIRAKASAQAAGLGIGHLPRWLAEPEIAAGRLVEKELADPRLGMPLHIDWRSRQPGKELTWFLGELEKPEEVAALASGL